MEKLTPPRHRGQTLVEFALVIPVLLLLAVVIFDFGRAVYYYSAVQNAAREGARFGAVTIDPYAPEGVIRAYIDGMVSAAENRAIGLSGLTIIAGMGTPEIVGGYANPTVKVTVTYTFIPATPIVANFISGGVITLKSEAVMRTEWLPRN